MELRGKCAKYASTTRTWNRRNQLLCQYGDQCTTSVSSIRNHRYSLGWVETFISAEAVYQRVVPDSLFSRGNSTNIAIDDWFECWSSGRTELDDDGNNKTARVARSLPTHRILSLPRVRGTQYDYSVTSLSVLYRTWRGDGKAISSSADDFINHRSFPSSITLDRLFYHRGELFPPIPSVDLLVVSLFQPTIFFYSFFLFFADWRTARNLK